MLSVMRRSANSWVIVLLFAAIIFVFALNFGPWAGNVGGGLPYAVDVNGRVITISEFQVAYSRQFQAIQSYRPGYTMEQAEKEGLKNIVLEQLISKELLAKLARDHGLSISDDELAIFIKDRLFGPGQPFDREIYRRLIYSNFQSTEAQFEAQLRRDLLAERMADLLATGVNVSNGEVKSTYENRSTRVSLDVLKIDPSQITLAEQIPQARAKTWAKEHQDEVAHYYNQHISEFRTEAKDGKPPVHRELKEVQDEIAVRLLLEQSQNKEAEKYTKNLLADLKQGMPMAKLSAKNPKAIQFLTTGFFRRDGRFIPEVGPSHDMTMAAFTLSKESPLSDSVFKVNNAYFLIKLKEKEEPDMKKFAEEEANIKEGLLMMRKRQIMQNYVSYLKKQASIKYNEQLVGATRAES